MLERLDEASAALLDDHPSGNTARGRNSAAERRTAGQALVRRTSEAMRGSSLPG